MANDWSEIFRPRRQPARAIYDAFQAEANKRKGRTVEEWTQAEEVAVWRAARDQAQMRGMPVPGIEQIKRAEISARGHTDYGAKWAYAVAEMIGESNGE